MASQALAAHAAELEELRAAAAAQLRMNERKRPSQIPAPRWHALEGQERAAAIARLASWIEAVYLPVYGHLAGRLGGCWPAPAGPGDHRPPVRDLDPAL